MDDHATPGDLLDNYDLIVKYTHAIHLLKLLCMNAYIEAFDAKTDTPLGRRAMYMDRRVGYNEKFYFLTDFMSGVTYLNKILQRLQLTTIRIQEGYVAATEHTSIPDQVQKVNHLRRALEDAAKFGNWEIGPDQLTLSELLFELIFRSIYSNAIAELADPDEPTAIVSGGDTEVNRIAERFSLLGQSQDFAGDSVGTQPGSNYGYGNRPPQYSNIGDDEILESWLHPRH
ncbi:unnamed protein product [Penicillium pancosmium]